jgi:hypothetical protein
MTESGVRHLGHHATRSYGHRRVGSRFASTECAPPPSCTDDNANTADSCMGSNVRSSADVCGDHERRSVNKSTTRHSACPSPVIRRRTSPVARRPRRSLVSARRVTPCLFSRAPARNTPRPPRRRRSGPGSEWDLFRPAPRGGCGAAARHRAIAAPLLGCEFRLGPRGPQPRGPRAQGAGDRQAGQLCRGTPPGAALSRAPSVEVSEQPGRELPPAHPAAGMSDEDVHLRPARPAVPVRLQRHLPALPAPSSPAWRRGLPPRNGRPVHFTVVA